MSFRPILFTKLIHPMDSYSFHYESCFALLLSRIHSWFDKKRSPIKLSKNLPCFIRCSPFSNVQFSATLHTRRAFQLGCFESFYLSICADLFDVLSISNLYKWYIIGKINCRLSIYESYGSGNVATYTHFKFFIYLFSWVWSILFQYLCPWPLKTKIVV